MKRCSYEMNTVQVTRVARYTTFLFSDLSCDHSSGEIRHTTVIQSLFITRIQQVCTTSHMVARIDDKTVKQTR